MWLCDVCECVGDFGGFGGVSVQRVGFVVCVCVCAYGAVLGEYVCRGSLCGVCECVGDFGGFGRVSVGRVGEFGGVVGVNVQRVALWCV